MGAFTNDMFYIASESAKMLSSNRAFLHNNRCANVLRPIGLHRATPADRCQQYKIGCTPRNRALDSQ